MSCDVGVQSQNPKQIPVLVQDLVSLSNRKQQSRCFVFDLTGLADLYAVRPIERRWYFLRGLLGHDSTQDFLQQFFFLFLCFTESFLLFFFVVGFYLNITQHACIAVYNFKSEVQLWNLASLTRSHSGLVCLNSSNVQLQTANSCQRETQRCPRSLWCRPASFHRHWSQARVKERPYQYLFESAFYFNQFLALH